MGEQLELVAIASTDYEGLEIDRRRRALELDARVESLCHEAVNVKDRLYEVLIPIHEGGYWVELGFKTWKDYIDQSVKMRIQTIWNGLKPRLELLGYGIAFEDIKGVTIESRLTKLALIAKMTSGKLDPALVEKAKTSPRVRNKESEFDTAYREQCQILHIEEPRTLRLVLDENLMGLWRTGVEAFVRGWNKREMGSMPKSPEVCFLEALLTHEAVMQMIEEN